MACFVGQTTVTGMRGFGLLSLSAVEGVTLPKSWNFDRVSKEVGLGGDERIFGEGCCCWRCSCCWRVDSKESD